MLKIRCKVNIYTDSIYVKNGITDWINNWKQNSLSILLRLFLLYLNQNGRNLLFVFPIKFPFLS